MSYDRDTKAEEPGLIQDPEKRAAKEAENGVRQIRTALEMVAAHIREPQRRPLRQSMIMDLHREAMQDVHRLAGTFRNSGVTIGVAKHIPPRSSDIPEYFTEMVAFINEHWEDRSAVYLASYIMWRLNWIHPFADGNGRTARVVSYLVLSMKMDSILPGSPTIPELIDREEGPRLRYYQELEKADEAYKQNERIAIIGMEAMIEEMLKAQLFSAVQTAGL